MWDVWIPTENNRKSTSRIFVVGGLVEHTLIWFWYETNLNRKIMSIQSQKRNELLQRGKALTLKSLILECNIRGHNPTDQRGIKRNQINYSKVALKGTKTLQFCTWGRGLAGKGTCSLPLYSGSILFMHACYPRGALSATWACRVFSGSGN
jgi:hypothetical protein